ncbi:hypothetical protein LY76DRAFT_510802, partial [Colletotrichum caudatum]
STVFTACTRSAGFSVDCTASLDWNSSGLPAGKVEILGSARLPRTAGWKVKSRTFLSTLGTCHGPVSWLLRNHDERL